MSGYTPNHRIGTERYPLTLLYRKGEEIYHNICRHDANGGRWRKSKEWIGTEDQEGKRRDYSSIFIVILESRRLAWSWYYYWSMVYSHSISPPLRILCVTWDGRRGRQCWMWVWTFRISRKWEELRWDMMWFNWLWWISVACISYSCCRKCLVLYSMIYLIIARIQNPTVTGLAVAHGIPSKVFIYLFLFYKK